MKLRIARTSVGASPLILMFTSPAFAEATKAKLDIGDTAWMVDAGDLAEVQGANLKVLMRNFVAITAFVVALSIFVGAKAEYVTLPRGSPDYQGFPRADLKVVRDHLAQLLKSPEFGENRKWRNPTTGNFGSMTISSNYSHKGRDCAAVFHIVVLKRTGERRPLSTTHCKRDKNWEVE